MRSFLIAAVPLSAGAALVSALVALPNQQQQQQQPQLTPGHTLVGSLERVEVVAPGMQLQHVYRIPLQEQGSWVSIALGPDGSMYATDQNNQGMYRIQISGGQNNPQATVTKVGLDVTGFQGMEYAFGSLYGNKNGGETPGLHRMIDGNEDGSFDVVEYFPIATGSGEHGIHAITDARDGEHLYFVAGNSSVMRPEAITRYTMRPWREDQILPRQAVGHARGRWAPGGFILKINADASDVVAYAMGFRNEYGADVNKHGELFSYDSDLEFDMGSSWYRPTRVNHVTSGADFGWRHGTGKLPPWTAETLPAVAHIGPGSPTGVLNGIGARYPAKYQNAMFVLDWTYSTLFAVHLTPNGSSYDATFEEFIGGNSRYDNSFQVTDAVIGADGYMYVLTGGRGTQGDLWRVVYTGNESTAPADPVDTPAAAAARALRKRLEEFHGRVDPAAVNAAWPSLASDDRFLRYAARLAVEWQPVGSWAQRALTETNPTARYAAIMALARNGTSEYKSPAIRSLLELPMAPLNAEQKLAMIRGFQLTFMRLGDPTEAERTQITAALNQLLPDPGNDSRVNIELVRTLIYLRDPAVTAKAMALIRNRTPNVAPEFYQPQRMRRSTRYGVNPLAIIANPPPTHVMEYSWMLRNQREGWTPELRREYFTFANYALGFRGGNVYIQMLREMVVEALRNSTPAERQAVADLTGRTFLAQPDFTVTAPQGPGRQWEVGEAIQAVSPLLTGRNYDTGRNLFFSAGCASCHTVGRYGGDTAPDLTWGLGGVQRIMEKIVRPDSVVEDNWFASEFTLADGRKIIGTVAYNGNRATIQPRGATPATEVGANEIVSSRKLRVSGMPANLGNRLNAEELAHLTAFIQAGGDRNHAVYTNPAPAQGGGGGGGGGGAPQPQGGGAAPAGGGGGAPQPQGGGGGGN